jgi:ATP-dependent helicase/nuclease subunit A
MSRPIRIPPDTLEKQARAADPLRSVWVPAHAGSGKTHVLAQRVVRLLLDGTDPARILCLTYTRAAAANMASRVTSNLAAWTMMPREALSDALASLDGRRPDEARIAQARRLFARALETPGGLKIQTIHAFCEAVLHQFTLEANIAGHFELMDTAMQDVLVAEARRRTILAASDGADGELALAFDKLLELAGESGLDRILREIVNRRQELADFIRHVGGEAHVFRPLFEAFGMDPAIRTDDLMAGVWPDPYFTAELAEAIGSHAAAAEKKTAQEFAVRLAAACRAPGGAARLDALMGAFFSGSGTARKQRAADRIMAKGVGEHYPLFIAEFARFAAVLEDVCDKVATLEMLHATRALLVVADRLIASYEGLKRARGRLDFADLVNRTVALLSRQDATAWVHYKLDRGIDHILLDEAQDTSPDQWAVVRGLAEEFFAGKGQHDDRLRTIFAVGDEKQSIYSFQGAEPDSFEENRFFFQKRAEAVERRFERVRLDRSFRSTQDVLSAVDEVFAREEMRANLIRDPEPIAHEGVREGEPGRVDIWPSIGPQEVLEPDDWTAAVDQASAPSVMLAERIAGTVAGWIREGEVLEGRGRKITAGDVLVLVRKRGAFVHALSRALKDKGIDVAGADRLVLSDHIAVKDLIALGRYLLQPNDDLSLAALLKSPVFAFDDDDLIKLGAERKEMSLHRALETRQHLDPRYGAAVKRLAAWRAETGLRTPFELYSLILGRDGVRRAMIARLGNEAGEVIDEFVGFCLASERTIVPSLEAFLALVETGSPEIKRELDQTRGEVRIMTAHASKGLEAPIVFLVDSGSAPIHDSHLPTLVPFDPPRGSWQGNGFVWRAAAWSNRWLRTVADAIRERAEAEYRRLLYVGMTRAEDRLVICGFHGKRGRNDACWHARVETALSASPNTREVPAPWGEGTMLTYRVNPERIVEPADETQEERGEAVVPDALTRPPVAAPRLPRPLAPSAAGALIEGSGGTGLGIGSPVLTATGASSFALARGTAVHKLLQMLPSIEPGRRGQIMQRYLLRIGLSWSGEEREGVARSVAAILSHENFSPLFSTRSRAEVSVMGTLRLGGTERAIAGKIDRLVVEDGRVLIVDYKTNRPAPSGNGDLPPEHVAQLALYRELLLPIYPGLKVEAALLYTEAPRLVGLDDMMLSDALAAIAQA